MRDWAERLMKAFSEEQVGMVAHRARALSDPTRVRILEVLGRSEQPVGQIALAINSQPSTVSKHLQVLFLAGLVQRRREASAVIYSLADTDLLDWCRYLGGPLVKPRRGSG
jgi:ArsR family transcriptional regulator